MLICKRYRGIGIGSPTANSELYFSVLTLQFDSWLSDEGNMPHVVRPGKYVENPLCVLCTDLAFSSYKNLAKF
jgi:hypothetical protein